ncbi:lipoprotein signal peptidase [Microscilla marina]|uniref:Lipoprotein signal peptidase n=1 Tax=Microscilla marina ATCC 23134 TaxID=313606 RepID=A1ZGC8_MICM2|nr:lipoprotein signal peptidase [Microscilla marina]EAY30545.1 signal peptidase [Microscilla marina ATCC 23134]
MKYYKVYVFVLGVILLDHTVKLWIHFNMGQGFLGQINLLGNWLKVQYELNSGMAFGVEWGRTYGKLALTIFRLLATIGILFYLRRLLHRHAHSGLIYCIALILGGAIGNLIDSVFYGVLLNNAPADVPFAWFHGQVIDMIYIDLLGGYLPHWIPFVGGKYVPATVFNIADAAIFIGVIVIIVRQKQFFAKKRRKKYKTIA